ncbi:MAG: cytochrome P450 [Gammaproteobacteria bacterium]|nr:MAG: cytochrome P450 [Gammaproteobacteria bacterium]
MSEARVEPTAGSTAAGSAWDLPLEALDPAQPELFQNNTHWDTFTRLRKEDPVHFTAESEFGPYWSITRYDDIMYVDTHHKIFSSEGGITIADQDEDFQLPMFIAMDPPKHDVQRNTVVGVVAPRNLAQLEPIIRERAGKILDELPRNETFDWVDRVSIELTTQMLATLFDFPFEERRKLTRWSDVATARPGAGLIETEEQRRAELIECLEYFTGLWNERVNKEPGNDLVSMLAHGESTKNMSPMEYLGNLILLIVGGNDTTRNSISGGVLALNQFPDQYEKLKQNPGLIPNMVAEIIRWQTPLAHMRRRALEDHEVNGKTIRAGDKVVMWYVSGNRDESAWERPNDLIIDRKDARKHVAFGYGIHRCMGNRLAEMQLRIVWEEIMKRFKHVEVMDEPVRTPSAFVKGYLSLPVRIHE